jgi:hypothetical protein
LRVADQPALSVARAVFLAQSDVPGVGVSLPPVLSAISGRPVQTLPGGRPVEAALAEVRSLLEQGTWAVFVIDETEGFKMADLRGPLADLAMASSAVLLPVGAHAVHNGFEYRIGASIPPDDLRILDHL